MLTFPVIKKLCSVTKTAFSLKAVFLAFISLLMVSKLSAQDTTAVQIPAMEFDSLRTPMHSAHKATLYSLMLPGLGQAYNKKYWKIPIIYAGFGALAYNFKINNDESKKFTEAYRYVINQDTFPIDNEYVTRYPDVNDLLRGRDFYRRRVELTVIFSAVWYLLNVIDATVDAHFFDYDISDNLTLHLEPALMIPTGSKERFTNGMRLCLNL